MWWHLLKNYDEKVSARFGFRYCSDSQTIPNDPPNYTDAR